MGLEHIQAVRRVPNGEGFARTIAVRLLHIASLYILAAVCGATLVFVSALMGWRLTLLGLAILISTGVVVQRRHLAGPTAEPATAISRDADFERSRTLGDLTRGTDETTNIVNDKADDDAKEISLPPADALSYETSSSQAHLPTENALEATFANLASFLNSLDAEGEQRFELSHSLIIICPDCGKNVAFRGRCPKCGGNSWIPAGHTGSIFERVRAQRLREHIAAADDEHLWSDRQG